MNMNDHALAVYICNPELRSLGPAQTCRVQQHQHGSMADVGSVFARAAPALTSDNRKFIGHRRGVRASSDFHSLLIQDIVLGKHIIGEVVPAHLIQARRPSSTRTRKWATRVSAGAFWKATNRAAQLIW